MKIKASITIKSICSKEFKVILKGKKNEISKSNIKKRTATQ